MDNLTHSLVGALLGQMGLKRKTGLAMPTLIIAANIPDIDAVATLLSGHQHLAIRRGITHGPPAMVILPLLLWGAMLWFDAWQTKRGKRPDKRLPIHKGWLLALAYIGCLSHPLFDWFNSYGIRLLEPFSSRWFYGDTLFIIDIWLLAILIGGWLWSRRAEQANRSWQRRAQLTATLAAIYILSNAAISKEAVSHANLQLAHPPEYAAMRGRVVAANPVPLTFWKRDLIVFYQGRHRDDVAYDTVAYDIFFGPNWSRPVISGSLKLRESDLKFAKPNEELKAFLFWSRFPIVIDVNGWIVTVSDQRFVGSLASNRFTVKYERRHTDREWIE